MGSSKYPNLENILNGAITTSNNANFINNEISTYKNLESIGTTIKFFYFLQNIYYYYDDYNKGVNNFINIYKKDQQYSIKISNELNDLKNIINHEMIISLINEALKLNNVLSITSEINKNQISLLVPNNRQIYNKLFNKDQLLNEYLFNQNDVGIPIYISWGLVSPENLYYMNLKPKSSIINFGPCIFDELSCYIKFLKAQKNKDNGLYDISYFIDDYVENANTDISNINLFVLALDNNEEINYILKFFNAMAKNIELYRSRSIYSNSGNSQVYYTRFDISGGSGTSHLQSDYYKDLQKIINESITYVNLDNSNNIYGPNVKIITIPTAESTDELNLTKIGLHIDKALDILDLLYNQSSTNEKSNTKIYIKTYSRYSEEVLYNNLIKDRFNHYVSAKKIMLSASNILSEFLINSKLNNLQCINSFNFNSEEAHNGLKLLKDNTEFMDLAVIKKYDLYNSALLDNLLINYLVFLSRTNNREFYTNTAIKKRLVGKDMYKSFVDYFNYLDISGNIGSVGGVGGVGSVGSLLSLLKAFFSDQHFNHNSSSTNYIGNRCPYFNVFTYERSQDLSNSFYWANDFSGIFVSSNYNVTENLIKNVYGQNILVKDLTFSMYNDNSLNIGFANNNILLENVGLNINTSASAYEYYISIDNSAINIYNNSVLINDNSNGSANNVKLDNSNLMIEVNDSFMGNVQFNYYLKHNNVGLGNSTSFSNLGVVNLNIMSPLPVITLNGNANFVLEGGGVFNDPGAVAYEYSTTLGGINYLSVDICSNLNINVLGNYTIIYSATDALGNDVSVNRNVEVVDTTAPMITINGNSVINHLRNTTYNDLSASAYDLIDGSLNVSVVNNVNSAVLGTYEVVYSAVDNCGNTASTKRVVSVIDWVDYAVDYSETSFNSVSSILTIRFDNYGSKNGTGYLNYDSFRILEVTTNILESQNIPSGPSFGKSFVFDSTTYYFVQYAPILFTSVSINDDISVNNSTYSFSLIQDDLDIGYIFITPPLIANDNYTITMNMNNFATGKTYALLFDDGTLFSYYTGDTNELIETFDIPTNNIFVWSM